MNIAFKNRISIQYLVVTALLMGTIFCAIYLAVKGEVYRQMDMALTREGAKHLSEITTKGDSIFFSSKEELLEREHQDVEVSPVFLQIVDSEGEVEDKSPNLKDSTLPFNRNFPLGEGYSARFKKLPLRIITFPIAGKEKGVAGYLLTAKPIEGSLAVLQKLRQMLWSIYPVLLLLLFFNSRFLAGRSIKPLQKISDAAGSITRSNLKDRVPVPQVKDEIYTLATTINELLDRLQRAFERERQFTSDASHELRTPLTALRGTLEVLIRKPREPKQYEEKVKLALSEINRLDKLVEQLLELARAQNNQGSKEYRQVEEIVKRSAHRMQSMLQEKQIHLDVVNATFQSYTLPLYLGELIFDNILGNAAKYTPQKGWINVEIKPVSGGVECIIRDNGEGINEKDRVMATQPFYRSTEPINGQIKGTGLGLAIAEKAAKALNGSIEIESKPGEGTTVRVKLRKF